MTNTTLTSPLLRAETVQPPVVKPSAAIIVQNQILRNGNGNDDDMTRSRARATASNLLLLGRIMGISTKNEMRGGAEYLAPSRSPSSLYN